jgi:hypothetical protein
MNKNINSLTRKVYLSYQQDGILDLAVGTIVLGFGLNMLTGNIVFLMVGWMAMLLYFLGKQRITIPRFGYVRFESEEKTFSKGLASVGVGVLVLFLFFAFKLFVDRQPSSSHEMETLFQRYHMVPLSGLLFGLPALGAAIFLGLKRFYLYALLAAGLPALGAWINIETYIPIVTTGLVMLVIGTVLLAGFLKKYPLNGEAGNNALG